jgi:hypothetical protein
MHVHESTIGSDDLHERLRETMGLPSSSPFLSFSLFFVHFINILLGPHIIEPGAADMLCAQRAHALWAVWDSDHDCDCV